MQLHDTGRRPRRGTAERDTMPKPLILEPFRRTAEDARRFAFEVHKAQTDKTGKPYTDHLVRVQGRLVDKLCTLPETQWDEVFQIAWLHDVIEATAYTAKDLRAEGFSANVVMSVDDLTRDPADDSPYMDWIGRIAQFGDLPLILVKLSDNEDDADPARLALLPEHDRERLAAKFEQSMPVLRAAARVRGWTP